MLITQCWGYEAKDDNPPTTVFISDYAELEKITRDAANEVIDVCPVGDKMEKMIVVYKRSTGNEESDPTGRHSSYNVCALFSHTKYARMLETFCPFAGNMPIACFTCAYGRIRLYGCLDILQERALYWDTGEWNGFIFKIPTRM